jgi:hypothetical protein
VDDEDSFATSDQSDNISVQSPDTTRHGTSPRQKKDKIRRQHLNLASITKNQNPTYNQDPSAKNKQNRTPDNGTLLWLPPPTLDRYNLANHFLPDTEVTITPDITRTNLLTQLIPPPSSW